MSISDGAKVLGWNSPKACPFADELFEICEDFEYEKHRFIIDESKLAPNRFSVKMVQHSGLNDKVVPWIQAICYETFGVRAHITISQVNRYFPDEVLEWHSDGSYPILTISVGETRNLLFRRKDKEVARVELNHGDVFVFNERYAKDYEHGMFEEPSKKGVRYSILIYMDLWPFEHPNKLLCSIPQNFTQSKPYTRLIYPNNFQFEAHITEEGEYEALFENKRVIRKSYIEMMNVFPQLPELLKLNP